MNIASLEAVDQWITGLYTKLWESGWQAVGWLASPQFCQPDFHGGVTGYPLIHCLYNIQPLSPAPRTDVSNRLQTTKFSTSKNYMRSWEF